MQVPLHLWKGNAVECASLPPFPVRVLVEALNFAEQRSEAMFCRRKLRVEIGRGAARPRANLLTDVAARDHRSDTGVEFVGDPGTVFYR